MVTDGVAIRLTAIEALELNTDFLSLAKGRFSDKSDPQLNAAKAWLKMNAREAINEHLPEWRGTDYKLYPYDEVKKAFWRCIHKREEYSEAEQVGSKEILADSLRCSTDQIDQILQSFNKALYAETRAKTSRERIYPSGDLEESILAPLPKQLESLIEAYETFRSQPESLPVLLEAIASYSHNLESRFSLTASTVINFLSNHGATEERVLLKDNPNIKKTIDHLERKGIVFRDNGLFLIEGDVVYLDPIYRLELSIRNASGEEDKLKLVNALLSSHLLDQLRQVAQDRITRD